MLKRPSMSVPLLSLLLGALISGCGGHPTPTSPRTGVSDGELRFIQLPSPDESPLLGGSQIYVEGKVTVRHGGRLRLKYKSKDVRINIRLRVRPRSVSEDVTVSLSLDPDVLIAEIDLVFGPTGLEFLRPAILRIGAAGLDLSGVDPRTFGLYYQNGEGLWELVDPIYLKVDFDEGEIGGYWWVDHFSRYALASR